MATSNTRYTPASQHDPDGDTPYTQYSQSPPSYNYAATAAAQDHARLFDSPRSSEDNVPDDFKFGGSVAEATIDIRNQFVRKVYTILTVQLLATGVVSSLSFWSRGYKAWIQHHDLVVWISLFSAMVFLGLTFWKRRSYPSNLLFLSAFTLTEAYSISVVVSFFDASVVLLAVLLTAGVFVFLTLFACQTKYDFTSWAPYLVGALWLLILFGFVAAFLPYNSTAELVYGGLLALVISGFLLVDTQMILSRHHVEEEIAAAISLYLDIINLFMAILRILNSRDD